MPFFTYIIYSPSAEVFYKGFTTNPEKRLLEHNAGLSRFTSQKRPWKLVYLEEFGTKSEALKREKALKRYNHSYIRALLDSPANLLKSGNKE